MLRFPPWAFFGDWKVIDATGKRGRVELETALRGTCEPRVLFDLFENFVAFMEHNCFVSRRSEPRCATQPAMNWSSGSSS